MGDRRWEVGGRRWEVGNVGFTMVLGRFGWKMMILQWF